MCSLSYLEVNVLGADVGLSHQQLGDVIISRLKNLETSGHVVGLIMNDTSANEPGGHKAY